MNRDPEVWSHVEALILDTVNRESELRPLARRRDLPKSRSWLYSPIMRKHFSFLACSLVVSPLLALCLTTAVWAEEASVTGTLTANGQTVELPHVYIYAEEKGFYDEKDPTWKIVFAAQPIEERELDSFFVDFPYVKIGITHTAEFDEKAGIRAYSQDVKLPGKAGNISGNPYPELKLESSGPEVFSGRIYLPKANKFFDDTYQYDFTFKAPLSDLNAPIGDPLPPGGGEPGKAYIAWVEAVHSGDPEQLKALVSPEMAEMLDTQDPADVAEELKLMKSMTPTDVKILSGSSDGKTAIIEVEGKMEGEALRGEITLVKEGELWMATKTSW